MLASVMPVLRARGIALATAVDMRRQAATRRAAALEAVAVIAVACFGWLGCARSAVTRGADFYQQGRYIDADQLFEQNEPLLASWEVTERARYGLYRGLTYLALGDLSMARRWLRYGAMLDAAALERLTPAERDLLFESLRAVGGPAAALNTASSGAAAGAGLVTQSVRLGP